MNEHRDLIAQVLVALRTADRAICAQTSETLARYGLTTSQFGVLEALYANGELRVCELVRARLSTSGNMTVILRNMERDGYVQRRPDPDDGRSSFVSLTDKGRAVVSRIMPERLARMSHVVDGLDDAEQRELVELLGRIAQHDNTQEGTPS